MAVPFRFKLSAPILLLLFCSYHPVRSSSESSSDVLALISFKSLITHDPDGALDCWGNTSLHFCRWPGVTCCNHTGEPRVTALDLDTMDIAGELSPSLGNLTFLQSLHISNTGLSGPIPHELSSLSNLRNLNLSYNSLEGEIPHTLSHCSRLRNISLRNNILHGEIPSNLSFCSGLQIIDFQRNNLRGIIPASLGSLKVLKMLLLWDNMLETRKENDWAFLTALANCSDLQFLALGRNRLAGMLPASATNLSVQLEYFDMSENQIYGGIPLGLEKLVNLHTLYLCDNLLSGTIPPSIGFLPCLELLSLCDNGLSGEIPTSFVNLSSLSELYLHTNNLRGGIPPSLGNLSSLTVLDLKQNNLTGEIPPLFKLLNLAGLYLDSNYLSGDIPPSLGKLRSLSVLELGPNNLSGFIPHSLWNLTSLIELDMENNNLFGSLPFDMGPLPCLKFLRLSHNQLHGPIPPSLFNSSALELLQLHDNYLDGTVPRNIGNLKVISKLILGKNKLQARNPSDWSFIAALSNCTNLEKLVLSSNRLGGFLPQSLVNLPTTLNELSLGWNQISGSIPTDIGNLIGLNWLDLELNNLTGTIPTSIGKLRLLNKLYLCGNTLTGEIPYTLGELSQLNELLLDYNNFSGHIPPTLGNCKQLTLLNLQNNKLIGSIPTEILSISTLSLGVSFSNNLLTGTLPMEVGLLVNLQGLDVSDNMLSGQISSSLGECVQMKELYLNGNQFQGIIPSSLRKLSSLEYFDLSHNNLSGRIPRFLELVRSLKHLNLSYNHLEGEVPKNGIFLHRSEFSVDGNDKLCGGILELELPPCPIIKISRKRLHSTKLAIIISVISIVLFFIVLLLILYAWRNQKSKKLPLIQRLAKDQHRVRVSYSELQKSTNGFSSDNLIGVGSFSSVYMGNMNHIWKKIIAVKVLNLEKRGGLVTFEAECEALRNVRHRNLVRLLTSCSSIDHAGNDFKALVFEFMSNGSLEKWLHPQTMVDPNNRKILTLIERVNIAVDVACALDYLHNHGPIPIIHCDLNPSNILLDDDMVAHVGDFGLACLLTETTTAPSLISTSSAALKGTIGYIAPEYGMVNQVSVEGDVYSYGIILLELFTGRRPTHEDLMEGLSLCGLVDAALPERAIEIIDLNLFSQEEGEEVRCINNINSHELECIASVLKVGLLCTKDSPTERMKISQASNALHAIRGILLNTAIGALNQL